MLKTNRLSEDVMEFRNSIIFQPIILSIAGLIAGGFLFNYALGTEWLAMNEDTIAMGLSVACILGGVAGLIFGPQVHTYVFDKEKNKIFYTRKKLTGTLTNTFVLDEVKRIVITISRNKGSDNKKSIEYKYNLQFEDEDMIEIASKNKKYGRRSRMSGGYRPGEIDELGEFLEIPIEKMGLKESFGEMIGTIKDMMDEKKAEKKDA